MTTPKVRVHEISKVLGVPNAEVIDLLSKDFGVKVKSHSSTVEQDVADQLMARFKSAKSEPKPQAKQEEKPAAAKQAPPVDKPAAAKAPEAPRPAEKPPEQRPQPSAPVAGQSAQQSPSQQRPGQPPQQRQQGAPNQTAGLQRPQQPSQQGQPQRPQQYGQPGQPNAGGRPPHPQQNRNFSGPQPGGFPQSQQSRPPQGGPSHPGGRPPAGGGAPMGGGPRPGHHGPSRPMGNNKPGSFGSGRPGQSGNRSGGNRSGGGKPSMRPQRREEEVATIAEPTVVRIDEALIVRDLATKLGLRDTEVIKHLFMKGMMVTVNQTLDLDFAKTVAKELGFEVEEVAQVKHEGEYSHLNSEGAKKLDDTKFKHLKERSPVVSIMGHVDHGKTTLLDAIRETRHKIVDAEAGGITQSIGAYTVEKGDHRIVFLDTPGHEAFTSMRMRGAQATDIAILVVAADDGVMPQTIEAINHAKVAKIPIIIAVNKIDKPDADPDRVLVQLAEYGLSAEKWGGDTLTVEVSALQKLGLDDLLDSILLVSELLELKADSTVSAQGVIIEAQLDKRMGPVATALVQNGTLRVGENVLIGSVGGRVRALIDDHGQRINSAGPATPVSILGLDGVPNAGDAFRVVHNDKQFKQALAAEKQRLRDERIGVTRSVAAGFSGRAEKDETKESQFNLLVKADTQGSLEAVVDVLQRMTSDEIKINIVHSATGDISEADVMLASTAKALLIGFNSKADANAQKLAEQGDVIIKYYDVIYHITEDIEKWVLGQLAPETEEVHTGTAEIRQIFKVGKNSVIAGCMVTMGKLQRNAKAVVLRAGKEVFSGPLANLKRFKDDVKEVASGYECGISFERFHDLQEGDIVEIYTVKSMERTSL